MESGSFHGAGASLIATSPAIGYPCGSVPIHQDPIHQKLDRMMALFTQQKELLMESKAETLCLKSRIDELGLEVTGLKQKLEAVPTAASPLKRKRIPRELSVSISFCFPFVCTISVCRKQLRPYMMPVMTVISLRALKGKEEDQLVYSHLTNFVFHTPCYLAILRQPTRAC